MSFLSMLIHYNVDEMMFGNLTLVSMAKLVLFKVVEPSDDIK